MLSKRKLKKKLLRMRNEALDQKEIMIAHAQKDNDPQKWFEAAFYDGRASACDDILFHVDLRIWRANNARRRNSEQHQSNTYARY